MAREGVKDAELRWKKLELLQEHYDTFEKLLEEVITNFMGFKCTDVQLDIGRFIDTGPLRSMVQAQRGQAKTTITAIYAVYKLIHDPTTRVLILSAGETMATEISNFIIQILMGMDEFECLRPDERNGDRSSVSAFDIHYSLKGPEKSPSVASVGINANLQGKRADLLIADDIESKKNSKTEIMREGLRDLTKDFTSICSTGKILYLGTPQSIDSVYNSLPSRGYTIRIWPGRYPTSKEEPNYGNCLSPLLKDRMANDPGLRVGGGPAGDRGKAVDPVLLDEDTLITKEIDQGAAYFQLQHMLNTRLMDAERYPLKSSKLVFMSVPKDRVPLTVNWVATQEHRVWPPQDFPVQTDYYEITSHSDEWGEFAGTHMYLDPSGGGKNGDEFSWAITKFQNGYVYLVDVGGMPGGLGEDNQNKIAALAAEWKPQQIDIEDNFGAGTLRNILTPVILKKHKCAIEGIWESGQKELRIIDALEPLVGAGRLIVDRDLIQKDWDQCNKYALDLRNTYSFFFQFARLTRDKGCLGHDDRLDAVAGSCRHWTDLLTLDRDKEAGKRKQDVYNAMMRNPLGNGRIVLGFKGKQHKTVFDRYRRD